MITLENINKKIGQNWVLKNISYVFESGTIYGLSGRNGSGKTMLLRTISGLILPTSGKITINNKVLHQDCSFPSDTGIIIENLQLLPQLTAIENLKMLAKIKKIATDKDIYEALKRVGLENHMNEKVKKYSLGMKQRLNIAQAIFEKPAILLLDEPLNAIDKEGVTQVRQILVEERNRGCVVIVASHLVDDLEVLCDIKVVIDQGEIISG